MFSNWDFFRFVRLGMGLAILFQGVTLQDWGVAALGLLFTYLPLANAGCCGSAGCYTPSSNKKAMESTKEISYDKID